MLIAIDDLQWSDRPSLRFVAYLAARLEGAPVLVAATVRSTDPGTDPQLLAEIAGDPLTEAGAARAAERGGGGGADRASGSATPDPAFTAACLEATGGNPLLLRHVLTALAAGRRRADRRRRGRGARHRLARRLADRAAAALAPARGGAPRSRAPSPCSARAPSCRPSPRSPASTRTRSRARPATSRARRSCAATRRSASCTRSCATPSTTTCRPASASSSTAARPGCCAPPHAADEEVAAQLVHARAAATPETVDAAARGGAPGGPARRPGERDGLPRARARGAAAARAAAASCTSSSGLPRRETNAPRAVEHLRAAYRRARPTRRTRATAAFALAQSQLFIGAPEEGGALARRAAAELPPELADLRQTIESDRAAVGVLRRTTRSRWTGSSTTASARGRRHRREDDGRRGGVRLGRRRRPGARGRGARARGVRRAASCSASGNGLSWSAVDGRADAVREPARAEIYRADRARRRYRRGSRFVHVRRPSCSRAPTCCSRPATSSEGGEAVGESRCGCRSCGAPIPPATRGRAALVGLQRVPEPATRRGRATGARRGRRRRTRSPTGRTCGGARWRRSCSARAGRPRRSSSPSRWARTAPHVLHPDWKPWQSLKARALAQLGRRDEALAAMEAELALARGVGGDRVIGRCLRQLGELEGDAGEPHLREAVELLSGTPARLELARALAALGGAAAPHAAADRGARAAAPGARAGRGVRAARRSSRRSARSSTRPARGRGPRRSAASSR